AIAVQVHGMTVGYLSREDARTYRASLREAGLGQAPCAVNAVIRGGWIRPELDEDDEDANGMYGISLDMDIPTTFGRI
ncbi:hypothetical protein, partial [Paenirhodobacter enshiensis]|uniref:hypothetical protein n=1 Tax=Paenirhodobacter enshiensis TaxID=1105367 RepID=UPI001B801686